MASDVEIVSSAFQRGKDEGITESKNFVIDYLGSVIDSGKLDTDEIRLVENILDYFENTLDPSLF